MQRSIGWLLPVLLLWLAGCASEVTSIRNVEDAVLGEREGFLLMQVDTSHNLKAILIGGEKSIVLTSADLRTGSNYILVSLPAGDYEIQRVTLNDFYYYRMDDDMWGFRVEEGAVSYVGNLRFQGARWGLAGKFRLINRSSFALEYLEANFQELLETHRLTYQGPGDDYYFDFARSN